MAPAPLRAEKKTDENFVLTTAGIISQTNAKRDINGLGSLSENPKLSEAAILKVKDMFNGGYFDHISPNGNDPSYFVKSAGYEYLMIGENLALGNFSGDMDLVEAWMNSQGHRENILHEEFLEIGVAVKKGTFEGKTIWMAVQEFGRPVWACPIVDESLKKTIDLSQSEINLLENRKNALLSEMKLAKIEKDVNLYNKKVVEYNALVEKYNESISELKLLVAQYNAQVTAFNFCIAD